MQNVFFYCFLGEGGKKEFVYPGYRKLFPVVVNRLLHIMTFIVIYDTSALTLCI